MASYNGCYPSSSFDEAQHPPELPISVEECNRLMKVVETFKDHALQTYRDWVQLQPEEPTLRPRRSFKSILTIPHPFAIYPVDAELRKFGPTALPNNANHIAFLAWRVSCPEFVKELITEFRKHAELRQIDADEYLPGRYVFHFQDMRRREVGGDVEKNDYRVTLSTLPKGRRCTVNLETESGRWPGELLLVNGDDSREVNSSFPACRDDGTPPEDFREFRKKVEADHKQFWEAEMKRRKDLIEAEKIRKAEMIRNAERNRNAGRISKGSAKANASVNGRTRGQPPPTANANGSGRGRTRSTRTE